MENMPAVIFATIVGTSIGLALHFQKAITKGLYGYGKGYLQNISS